MNGFDTTLHLNQLQYKHILFLKTVKNYLGGGGEINIGFLLPTILSSIIFITS